MRKPPISDRTRTPTNSRWPTVRFLASVAGTNKKSRTQTGAFGRPDISGRSSTSSGPYSRARDGSQPTRRGLKYRNVGRGPRNGTHPTSHRYKFRAEMWTSRGRKWKGRSLGVPDWTRKAPKCTQGLRPRPSLFVTTTASTGRTRAGRCQTPNHQDHKDPKRARASFGSVPYEFGPIL